MKTTQRQLDNIKGFDLTKKEQKNLSGGEQVPCPIKCQLYVDLGPIGEPDCCPYYSIPQCEAEIEAYYSKNNWSADCWFV